MQLGSGLGAGSFLGKMQLVLHSGAWQQGEQWGRQHSELGGQSHLSAASALPLYKQRCKRGNGSCLAQDPLGCRVPALPGDSSLQLPLWRFWRSCPCLWLPHSPGWGWARLVCGRGGTRAQQDQIVLVPYQPSCSLGQTVGKTKWGGFHSRSTLGIEV